MNNLIVFKHSLVFVLIFSTISLFGQKKYVESFNTSKDILVTVNTSHTNVIFKTWNKNKVEVEAFIDDDSLSEKEKQELFDNWKFNVMGNSKNIVITSNDHYNWRGMNPSFNFDEMQFEMEFLGPLLENIDIPEIPDFEMPPMPELFLEGMSEMHFDYEEFKENEKEYMEQWEAQFELHFGKDFEDKMEAWGDKFAEQWNEKKSDSLSNLIEARMKEWEAKHGKKMEELAKRIAENTVKWEKQAKEMEKRTEMLQKKFEDENIKYLKKGKVNRTIIIRMPKNTKTDINVRHGELIMADAFNVKATLNYSPFSANSVDGGKTLINAAYAPVIVNNWIQGDLVLKYVENCSVQNIETINLIANSSDVSLGNIIKNAFLSGSYGMFKIDKVSNNFESLDINLENTDAVITIPTTKFSFTINGTYSTLKNPKSITLKNNNALSKYISVNAVYSNVIIQ